MVTDLLRAVHLPFHGLKNQTFKSDSWALEDTGDHRLTAYFHAVQLELMLHNGHRSICLSSEREKRIEKRQLLSQNVSFEMILGQFYLDVSSKKNKFGSINSMDSSLTLLFTIIGI